MPPNRKFCGNNALRSAFVVVGLGLGAASTAAETQRSDSMSGWRLSRTANPRGGPEAISMSHIADIARSDVDLAGLMLRCGEKGIEVAIVVVTPFSPRAHPDVTIDAGGKKWHFSADVVPPGAELLLPPEATSLAAGPWQFARELSVKVVSPEQSISGVMPIEGIDTALATLATNCQAG